MNKVLLVNNSLILVWAYPEKRMIHHQMKAYCHGDELREGLLRGVEAMERYGARKWLSDDRAGGPLTPEDAAWAGEVWFPRVKAVGWKRWGIVKPVKVIGQSYLDRIARTLPEHGIEARMFGDLAAAMKWLDEI